MVHCNRAARGVSQHRQYISSLANGAQLKNGFGHRPRLGHAGGDRGICEGFGDNR